MRKLISFTLDHLVALIARFNYLFLANEEHLPVASREWTSYPQLTIVMAVYHRPARTRRMIKLLQLRTLRNFEAFILGDGCPMFDGYIPKMDLDRRFHCHNWPQNHGGWGYKQLNWAIQNCRTKYIMFVGNDDLISRSHLKTYLKAIEGTDLDFVYVNCILHGKLMRTKLQFERIGHGALIVRTAFIRQMPLHTPNHHHDWEVIEHMIKGGAKFKKKRIIPTLYVLGDNAKRKDPQGFD